MSASKLNEAIAPSDKLPTVWHSLDIDRAIDLLVSDREQGLSTAQVKERAARFGANELTAKKKKSLLLRFLLQFNEFRGIPFPGRRQEGDG